MNRVEALPAAGVLSAWRYPGYRYLWASFLAVNLSRWMETVVIAWLILELTDSPFMVGLAAALRSAGMVLGPYCGALADRVNRRRILITVLAIYSVAAITMTGLALTARLNVGYLFAFVTIGGICYAFDFSTRFPAAGDVVEGPHLATAVSLLFVTMGFTSGMGPFVGGSLLGTLGAVGCFAVMAGCLLLSTLMLWLMGPTPTRHPGPRVSPSRSFSSGLRYVASDRTLLALILIAALINLALIPGPMTLLPVFTRDVLHQSASDLGRLMAVFGVGGLLGALAAGALERTGASGRALIAAMLASGAGLALLSMPALYSYHVSLLLLFLVGGCQYLAFSLIQTLLLKGSSEEMRGRVSGVRSFAIIASPVGNLLSGAGARAWGSPVMFVTDGLACIAFTIGIAVWATGLRRR